MKKRVNLYIVCSTKSDVLLDQKRSIISLCQKLNKEYALQNSGDVVNITAVGYDDPENEGVVSKKFIDRNADLVVFLFDKSHSEKERERMERKLADALHKYRNNRRPEILVYLPKDAEKTLSDKTRKLLGTQPINIKQFEDTDLNEVVDHNIRAYVNSYEMIHNARREAILTKIFAVFLAFALLGIIALLTIMWVNAKKDVQIERQKRILIAGGGSAKNFIVEKKHNLKDRYWIYAPMASGNAYRLLTEETAMDTLEKRYYTVLLSAGKTGDSSFFRNDQVKKNEDIKAQEVKRFRNFGVIVGVHMGMDSLVVYSSHVLSNKNNGSISISDLKDIYKKWKDHIYTTNENSGTLNAYNNLINTKIKPNKIFYSSETIEDTSWIALGSSNYHPKNDGNNIYKYIVKDEKVEAKPIYVYFIKYRSQKDGSYTFPEEVKRFLSGALYFDIPDLDNLTNNLVNSDSTNILFDVFCLDTNCKTHNIKIKEINHAK